MCQLSASLFVVSCFLSLGGYACHQQFNKGGMIILQERGIMFNNFA